MRISLSGSDRKRSSSRRDRANSQPNRRSDAIRSRRSEHRAAPAAARRKPAVRSQRNDPPVLTRTPVGEWPAVGRKKRSTGQLRRRYDVALSSPGAEIRLPSLPRVRPGWRLLSFALVAALGVLLYQLWTAPEFQVQAAEVSGLQLTSAQDVNAILDVTGRPIFAVDEAALSQKLETAFPEFEQVAVSVELPHSVHVEVSERLPVLAWHQGGRLELVDKSGMAFPMRKGSSANIQVRVEAQDALPALEPETEVVDMAGERPGERAQLLSAYRLLTPEMVSAALTLSEHLPEGAVLAYDNQRGYSWVDPAGWQVYFGMPQDMEMKLAVYQSIVQELRRQEVQPALISVEFVHAPYYRLAP